MPAATDTAINTVLDSQFVSSAADGWSQRHDFRLDLDAGACITCTIKQDAGVIYNAAANSTMDTMPQWVHLLLVLFWGSSIDPPNVVSDFTRHSGQRTTMSRNNKARTI